MKKVIDWKEVYQALQLNMDVYELINAGMPLTSAEISKDEYVVNDSE